MIASNDVHYTHFAETFCGEYIVQFELVAVESAQASKSVVIN